jgi:hypothetical protein
MLRRTPTTNMCSILQEVLYKWLELDLAQRSLGLEMNFVKIDCVAQALPVPRQPTGRLYCTPYNSLGPCKRHFRKRVPSDLPEQYYRTRSQEGKKPRGSNARLQALLQRSARPGRCGVGPEDRKKVSSMFPQASARIHSVYGTTCWRRESCAYLQQIPC